MRRSKSTVLAHWLPRWAVTAAWLAVGSLSASTVGYWRFEDGAFRANTVDGAKDLTGTGRPTQTALSPTGPGRGFPDPIPQNGRPNEDGAVFDGANFFASGGVGGEDFRHGRAVTFEVFFNADSFDEGTNAFGGIWDDAPARSFLFGVRGAGNHLRVTVRAGDDPDGSANQAKCNSSLTVEAGKDYYAAARIDGANGVVTFFLQNLTDGGPLRMDKGSIDFGEAAGFMDNTAHFTIGSLANGDNAFHGLIDEVRLSDAALNRFALLAVPEPSGYAVSPESERPKVSIAAAGASRETRDRADHVAEGAKDETTLQSAMEALPEAGGAILLSGGTFEISAPVEIPSDVKLIGAGRDRTLLRLDPGNVSLGLHTGVVRVYGADTEIRNLSIDASNPDNREVEDASNRSSGVYLDIDSENALLENIAVRNTTRHGVAVLGKGHTLRNIRAEKAAKGYCISIGDGSRARPGAWDIRIDDLFVRDSGGRGGVEINDGVDGVVIDGFYSGGHGNHTRGAVHIREHGRENEYVRNVTLRDGVIDLSDATVDYRHPSRRGVIMASDQNRIENIVLKSIEFRSVSETGVLLRGNIHGVRLNGLDFTGVDGAPIRIESVGDTTPQDVTLDGEPYQRED